ncbi:glucose-1-phosphate thymidylyltransferase [Caldivirga maquilingensis]|uniref:Glucose-1-phosphate thymidyltransferase n=1 Tax=Caldivirga maquilingensis (strain ATCC 700844 / DSM 13496 / JCM 10307 / IC-167) TaxID=397948 RepID=A8M980_CALMQ|nr:glucose-1-phosphate thymidylyltransferase [Caldivirga maquilingensis]ABW02299.1 glucose-1-phosphate thymidyltransferase [Caldivirga maquilingensis IC-167]
MLGLILVAGIGERMRPLSYSIPKPLISILGKPLVAYTMDKLKDIDVSRIGLVVGRFSELFMDYFNNDPRLNIPVTYIRQERRLGIAHAIYRGIEEGFLREDFVVALGDNYFSESFTRFAREFLEGGYDVFIVLTRHQQFQRFGNAVVEGGRVVRLIEKPNQPIPNSYVVTGLYFFRDPDAVAKAFSNLRPSARGEYEVTDLIQWFIDNNYRVGYSLTTGWWKDMGTPEDLIDLVQLMLDDAKPRIDGDVRGRVSSRVIVEKGAVVEGAVHGPAYVGRGVYVGKDAEIEHFVSLEEGVHMESGSISRSLILEGVTLHLGKARLTDSVIGPRSYVILKNGRHRMIIGENGRVEEV